MAVVYVQAGPNTLHACFVTVAQMELYQPKYANMIMNFTVNPPNNQWGLEQGRNRLYYGKYGIGTSFHGTNMRGQPEVNTITEFVPPDERAPTLTDETMPRITFTSQTASGPWGNTYKFTPQQDGSIQIVHEMTHARIGQSPLMGQQLSVQLNAMKDFIELNVGAICKTSPPGGHGVGGVQETVMKQPSPFCGACGMPYDGNAFCGGCGKKNGDGAGPAGDGFVVPPRLEQGRSQVQVFQMGAMAAASAEAAAARHSGYSGGGYNSYGI